MLDYYKIKTTKARYLEFISNLALESSYKLTPKSELTPYARCFAIFGYHLLLEKEQYLSNSDELVTAIRQDLDHMRDHRRDLGISLKFDKNYLQLLTFSLSALSILNRIDKEPLEDHILPLLSNNIEDDLNTVRAFEGKPRSGNQAMFMAIILYHARNFLGRNVDNLINDWQRLHLDSINQFGFWGEHHSMSHLQFQNGYHQYEILDYFETINVPWSIAAESVATLADKEGHFAPYPGGGGCYDYDAIYILTNSITCDNNKYKDLLIRTANSILSEQNYDGGFCESHKVRPLSISNLSHSIKHVLLAEGESRVERMKYSLTLLRPKHARIHTHWSTYSRKWSESNLWDSWFRMLTLARIDVSLNPSRSSEWGFINYPGIGYHQNLKNKYNHANN